MRLIPVHVYDEELYDLYFATNIIRVIKSRGMRSAGHVAHRVLAGRRERRSLGRLRRR
jgi:hypothetical protein